MIKHLTFLRLLTLCVGGAALLSLFPVTVHAAQTTTATVTFTRPKAAVIAVADAESIKLGPTVTASQDAQVLTAQVAKPVAMTELGLAEGWTLSVAASNLVDQAAQHTIKAAQLRLGSGTTVTTGDPAGTPVATDTAQGVSLRIPTGNAAGSYQADLTWTLVNSIQE
ncbi:hypothetical protein [Lacticaseibacillus jixiensis]|uniref:hypothetical protein n=1 Tax=Lacticaseibacillus jixiensis TaxID=3231926 RepID=UPI0036F2C32B